MFLLSISDLVLAVYKPLRMKAPMDALSRSSTMPCGDERFSFYGCVPFYLSRTEGPFQRGRLPMANSLGLNMIRHLRTKDTSTQNSLG